MRAARRIPPTLASSTVSAQQSQRASIAGTAVGLQQQHASVTLTKTHGFGMINHGAVISKDSKTTAAADLARTSVQHGLGTSAADPYLRTLPNLELRAAETTVVNGDGSSLRASLDEIATLGSRREGLRYWIGNENPRLPLWLRSLKTQNALPLSSKSATILTEFETVVIPAACAERGEDVVIPQKRWQSLVRRFLTIPRATVLSRAAFEGQLELATKEALSFFGSDAPLDELISAVEVLRRQAIQQRNAKLDDLATTLSNGTLVAEGDAVWATFFSLVRDHRESFDLFSNAKEGPASSLEFVWDSIVEGTAVPALVSAPVALYLVALTAAHTVVANDNTSERIHGRVDQLKHSEAASTSSSTSTLVAPIEKRIFVRKALQALSSSALLSEKSEQILRSLGVKKELPESIINALAAETVFQNALNTRAAEIAKLFRDPAQGGLLLYRSTTSTDDASVKTAVQKVLSANGFAHTDEVRMNPSRWASKYESIASTLLKHPTFVSLVYEAVRAETGASQNRVASPHGIVSEDGLKQLGSLKELRDNYERRRAHRAGVITDYLSSYEGVDAGVRYCAAFDADMTALTALQRAGEDARNATATTRSEVAAIADGALSAQIVAAIAEAHPSWVRANVIERSLLDQSVEMQSQAALRAAVRMYIRLTYVPHAGAATIARNTRRRIGPVGTAAHEQNIAVEVGMVEKMDNLLHKRYDWQGWYQRMQDVHNRNVSLRFKLHDLRTLDSQGKPFFDMQSERRLRIVAKERVGMGILKLDSDKYEDQKDNYTFGSVKISQLVADAKKTMLGPEYVPTVEVKVRRPSGQSKLQYSALDYDRLEKKSAELYQKYAELKKKSFFVPPTDVWLDVAGLQVRKNNDAADVDGYTVDLFESMNQKDN
jgi:hypothetical protein